MPGFPFPSRPGRELGEPLLDALLDRQSLPPDAPQQVRTVAQMLADLASPAEPGELAGETAARSAFTHYPSPADASPATRRSGRRHPWTSRGAKLAAALITAAVGLGGATAYAGVLPGPVQDFAHHMIGAPPAHRADPLKPQPSGGKPGTIQPSTNQPSTNQPSGGKPGTIQPSGGKPGKVQPSKVQPSKVQPSKVQPSTVQPSRGKPSKVQPSKVQREQGPARRRQEGGKGGQAQQGPAEQGPAEQGPARRRQARQGPAQREPAQREPARQGQAR